MNAIEIIWNLKITWKNNVNWDDIALSPLFPSISLLFYCFEKITFHCYGFFVYLHLFCFFVLYSLPSPPSHKMTELKHMKFHKGFRVLIMYYNVFFLEEKNSWNKCCCPIWEKNGCANFHRLSVVRECNMYLSS